MARPGPTREPRLAQKPAANSPFARWFSHFCVHHVCSRRRPSRVRYLATEESSSMAPAASNISHSGVCRVDRRSLVPRSDPRPGSTDDLYRARRDLCFRSFFNCSFFESGQRSDRGRSMVLRIRAAASGVLEVFGPSDGPGRIHDDRDTRANARARDNPDVLSLARNWRSFRVDFRKNGI